MKKDEKLKLLTKTFFQSGSLLAYKRVVKDLLDRGYKPTEKEPAKDSPEYLVAVYSLLIKTLQEHIKKGEEKLEAELNDLSKNK